MPKENCETHFVFSYRPASFWAVLLGTTPSSCLGAWLSAFVLAVVLRCIQTQLVLNARGSPLFLPKKKAVIVLGFLETNLDSRKTIEWWSVLSLGHMSDLRVPESALFIHLQSQPQEGQGGPELASKQVFKAVF